MSALMRPWGSFSCLCLLECVVHAVGSSISLDSHSVLIDPVIMSTLKSLS